MADHFYVSAQDAGKTAILLGPFTDEKLCREYAYADPKDGGNLQKHTDMLDTIYEIDPKSTFYALGMFKVVCAEMCPFNYKGMAILNKIDPEKWDKVIQ